MAFFRGVSSHTVYRPYDGSAGYSHTQLTVNQYEVNFSVPDNWSPVQAVNFAKYRAAEVGKSKGFEYLEILNSSSERISLGSVETVKKKTTIPQDTTKKEKVITDIVSTDVSHKTRIDAKILVAFSNTPGPQSLFLQEILEEAMQSDHFSKSRNPSENAEEGQ